MARAQARRVGRNAEQGADEILERPRNLDQQIRFILGRELVGRGTRRHKPSVQFDMALLQPFDEGGVETAQALAVVEVIEARPEGERERGHASNIRVRRGVIVRMRTD
jgi:hypothetical protein